MDKKLSTLGHSVPKRLLIIDDEENMRHMLTAMLRKSEYEVETAADGQIAMEMLRKQFYDFILCDIRMPNMSGMDFLRAARDALDQTTVIMMSAYGNIDTAIEAMKLGAYDYISKPFKSDEVYLTLKKAEEREKLKTENRLLKERIRKIGADYKFASLVGKSDVMQEIFQLAQKVSQYDTTVLITGESGTGKELIARAIHFEGKRQDGPFVPVNCGGIPDTLLESELFGYKKGAFTGADRDKKGLFEEAEKGTIFLDEIGEMPLTLQVKLLRVLQENEVRPVGDAKTRKIEVRVIAATAKNLEDEIRAGSFREDLFYRLNVWPIHLPTLFERIDDIPLLCRHFIERYNQRLKKQIQSVSESALATLMRYSWPGNVRELENVIERALVLAEGPILLKEHLPPNFDPGENATGVDTLFDGYSLKAAQKIVEQKLIVKALQETDGNRTQAARLLEISHPSLLSKMKAYKIDL